MPTRPTPPFPKRRLPLLLLPGLSAVCLAAVAGAIGFGPGASRAEPQAVLPNEPGEENPGGSATTQESVDTREAFSHFSHGIGFEGEAKFKVGNAIFRKLWISAPSSTTSSDGLGPLYNSRSCQSCHLKDGRGHPPNANFPADTAESMFLRLSIPPQNDEQRRLLAEHRVKSINEPTYGEQLQNIAIQGLDNEGHMHIDFQEVPVTLGDGTIVSLRHPTYSVDGLKFGPMHPQTMMSPRLAPPMIGLGLIEAIPEEQIRAHADPDDKDHDGISGRTNEVWSLEKDRLELGRFGWKAGAPSIRQQAASAFAGDMGLSNPLVPNAAGDCTAAETACLNAPNGNTERDGGFEVSPKLFDHVTFYSQNLAVPPRRNFDDPTVAHGKALFYQLGCQSCHAPSFTTGSVEDQPHLSNQKIWPYSDLLLHDMGKGLADNRPEGMADGQEWRTAPLWGIGLTKLVSGHTLFLHDGRARNVEEAILWHEGEAQASRDGYAALSKADRDALIAFVEFALSTRRYAASISLLATSLLVLSAARAAAFDDAALARQAYERHILPGYAGFASSAQDFATSAATLCKAPSADALAKTRDAARSAVIAWGRMENIRFGPITTKQRLERLLFYPDPHGIARRQIDRLLASRDTGAVSAEKLAGASVAVQGFSAVDRVLYGKGSDELAVAAPAVPFRCLYLQALAADIAQIAEDTHAEWAGDYKSTWLSPGGADKTYLSAKETTLALFRSYVTELQVIRLQRLVPLLGHDEKASGHAEALLPGGGLALPFILANIEGERALLTESGFVDPALASGDKEQSAMAILGSIVTDLGFAIRAGDAAAAMAADPFADAAARDRLAPMLLSLKNAEETGRAALGDLTGQSLGFNSLDGD